MSPCSGGGYIAVFKHDIKTSNPASTDIHRWTFTYVQYHRAADLDITHCQYIFNHIRTLIIIPINSVNKIVNSAGVNAAEG